MYSAYKLNKQGDNIQLWCTPLAQLCLVAGGFKLPYVAVIFWVCVCELEKFKMFCKLTLDKSISSGI